MPKGARPVVQALLLADHVYIDRESGKTIIAGTFDQIWATEFPTVFGRATWAFVSLTDLRGPAEVVLRYVDLTDGSVLLTTNPIPVATDDPLKSAQIRLEIPPLPMPHAGAYALELMVGGALAGTLRVVAGQHKPEASGEGEGEGSGGEEKPGADREDG